MIENLNFRVAENKLCANQDVKHIAATNGIYDIAIFYYGDYKTDKADGAINIELTSFYCKPDGIHPILKYMGLNGTVSIEIPQGEILYINNVDGYKARIDTAKASALALVDFLKSYGFPAEI